MAEDQVAAELPSGKVTVLIPSYNYVEGLRRCIQSVEGSAERERIEILVVDKGSRDGSGQIDAELPQVTMLRLPRNFGQTKALNIGLRTATGEYVLILPPEFTVAPEAIATLRKYLEDHPDTIAVVPAVACEDGVARLPVKSLPDAASLWSAWTEQEKPAAREVPAGESEVDAAAFTGAPVLVRREFIRGMNFFDERYGEYGWEPELSWQIRGSARRLVVLTTVVASRHEECRLVMPAGARAQLEADRALGMAAYLGKHVSAGAGVKFRFQAGLRAGGRALGSLLKARDVGYHVSLFISLVSGQKVDGSQSSL